MDESEGSLVARQRKASALRRRMKELRLTEKGMADMLRLKSREAVTLWRAGKTWPTPPTEETLERRLDLPVGFFDRMGAGQEYTRVIADSAASFSLRVTLREVEAILRADPTKQVGDDIEVLTMADLQRALRAQVASLVRFARSKSKTLKVGKTVILGQSIGVVSGLLMANALPRALSAPKDKGDEEENGF